MELRAYTVLQKEELEQGREQKLSEEAISLYSDRRMNYLQMRAVRNALNSGISAEAVSLFAKFWIPAWQIEEFAEEVRNGEQPAVPKRPLPREPFLWLGAAVTLLGILPMLASPSGPVQLELTSGTIRIPCGAEFEPERYVKEFSGEDVSLFLPEKFTADRPGPVLVQYRAEGKKETVRKNLRVEVVDDQAPSITLTSERAELLREAPFSCHAYVMKAMDEVDGDLTRAVICSDVLTDEETQQVSYQVKDQAGNTATAVLHVHFADSAPAHPETAAVNPSAEAPGPAASQPAAEKPVTAMAAPVIQSVPEPEAAGIEEPPYEEETEEPLLQ